MLPNIAAQERLLAKTKHYRAHTQKKEEIRVAVEYFILTYVTGAAAAADDASPPHIHTLAYFSRAILLPYQQQLIFGSCMH